MGSLCRIELLLCSEKRLMHLWKSDELQSQHFRFIHFCIKHWSTHCGPSIAQGAVGTAKIGANRQK